MKKYKVLKISIVLSLVLVCFNSGGNICDCNAGPVKRSSARIIAVMPFVNQTGNKNISWLGPGVADSLSSKLSAVEDLVVVERAQISSIVREKELGMTGLIDEAHAPKLGKMLGARILVLGSFAGIKASGKIMLRFNCKIVDTETGRIIGGGGVRAKGSLDSIFNMEEKIAEDITKRIGIVLTGAEKRYLKLPASSSVTAYELYSLALDEQDYSRKKKLLLRAISYDKKFARAHLSLGYVLYGLSSMEGESPELVTHLNTAVRIDPRLIEANYILGSYYDRLSRMDETGSQLNRKNAVSHYKKYVEQAERSPLRTVMKRVKRSRKRIGALSGD